MISDPKFVGPHSVMKVALSSALRFASHFSLEVRPESADGTLLYLGQTRDAKHLDFFSLALRYGHHWMIFLTQCKADIVGPEQHMYPTKICQSQEKD